MGKKKAAALITPWFTEFITKRYGVAPQKLDNIVNATLVAIIGGSAVGAFLHYRYSKKAANEANTPNIPVIEVTEKDSKVDKKVRVDMKFFRRLIRILKICIPGWKTKEMASLFALTFLLISRTLLSIVIADLSGKLAQTMVSKKWDKFGKALLTFFLITIPASAVNSCMKYFTAMLALRFRRRLTIHVNHEYLDGVNFYKACNLGGDSRIDSADQRVTSDIEKFANAICNLYTTVSKPVLDVILFTKRLMGITGWQGPLLMYGYFIVSGVLKKVLMPPLGKLAARESELEGSYRTAHQRLIVNSEEIAFYDGSEKEKAIINALFHNIFKHTSYVHYLRCLVGVFDGLLVKYWATIVGYGVMASPLLLNKTQTNDSTKLTNDYIRNSSYLIALAQAVGQLVLIGNKITELAGFTSRVSELLEMVKHLQHVGNEPFEIIEAPRPPEQEREEYKSSAAQKEFVEKWTEKRDKWREAQIEQQRKITRNLSSSRIGFEVPQGKGGKIIKGDMIKFENVDIVSPEGKLLVKGLSFEVPPGRNVMVTGPNGSGKSSLFRIIGGLWPLHNGVLTKPRNEDFLFVPQKPYQVLGTLRDQIIYPNSLEQMKEQGVTDDDLEHLLSLVDPSRIIRGQWDWDEVKDWITTFSGGQKQRVAMARLFYHKPRFAILDECTSAVSEEVEGKIYETCKSLGITLFTVSHRRVLQKYHDYQLTFEGNGNYTWTKLEH